MFPVNRGTFIGPFCRVSNESLMRALIIFCMSFWRTLSSIDIQIIDVTDDAEVVTKSSRCSLLLPKAKEEISFMGLIPSRSTVRIEMSTK